MLVSTYIYRSSIYMTCDSTATIATDTETYTNQRLRCDSALPPDYHAGCHGPFCHVALTSSRVDTPSSVAVVAVFRADCHHCHGPRDRRCASPCRPSAALQHSARADDQPRDDQRADDQARRGGCPIESGSGVDKNGPPTKTFIFLVPSPNVPRHVRFAHSLSKPRQRPLICSATSPSAPEN